MRDETESQAPQAAKVLVSPGPVIAGVVVLQVVIAVFLSWMTRVASEASAGIGAALVFGAATAAIGAALALALWSSARSTPRRVRSLAWMASLLPLVATGVAFVMAIGGWVPWITVGLALFAGGPVAALGAVLPSYLTLVRSTRTVPSNN